MKILLGTLCTSCLTLGGFAQQPAAGDAMSQVSRSASQELQKSSQELAKLREQIASEQLPLAQELTSSEELLLQLRKEYETVSRTVDSSNLDLPRIQADNTFRRDELAYLGNLLDDYARTFDSKVHVSELQYCSEAIEDAKQATEDTTLAPPEKFTRQLAFVDVSIRRLADVIGGMRFQGVGVDAQGAVSEGQFAIIGPVALFCAAGAGAAGLVVPQTGSNIPLIRPLEGALQAGLVALVQTGDGQVPLDPSRGGALKALVQKTNLIHIFEKGGPIMWPLLAASILALGTVIERLFFLMREKMKRDSVALDHFFAAIGRNDPSAAADIAKGSRFYVLRALGYALTHDEQSLPHALMYAQAQEMKRFRRGIPILDTVITLAPLLGLLGTVTGMMGSFSIIGGELSAPGAITGGIAEALIATAFGLGIAITALIPFNYLNTRAEEANHELESAGAQLELLVRGTQVVEHILRPPEGGSQHDVRRPPTGPTTQGRPRDLALT
ncbi:MAG: MotA/TolQ/ExbB proton channel family protein [Planctomycetota bacterium]